MTNWCLARISATRAVTVEAPVAEVWPWLAQIGQGRGGLYSYDGLENLLGAGSTVPTTCSRNTRASGAVT